MKEYNNQSICFDDILLVPQESNISSRHSVDLSSSIGYGKRQISLGFPVIAAPMDTVCDVEMCMNISKFGGLGILHRYMKEELLINKTKTLSEARYLFGVSVAATNGYMNVAEKLYGAGARIFLVDTANGHSHYAINAVKNLRSAFGEEVHIMGGNVATWSGFANLADAGADSVRVGIGGGSACTTRIVSGHGVPTLESIMDVSEWKYSSSVECSIIADGGIRNSGDMVKSFAAGANAVMVGSMLAGTDEAPGEVLIDAYGKQVKMFRGMASSAAQKDSSGKISVAEGISTTIPYKGSVDNIFEQIKGGLGSGCSYSGVDRVADLYLDALYTKVSPLSKGESLPHATA